jgi:hypothetical protein
LLAVSLLTGCVATGPAERRSPGREPVRFRPCRVRPLAKPWNFKGDYASSREDVLHHVTWNRHGCLWTLRLPAKPDAHAGVLFTPVRNLPVEGEAWLTLEIKPADMGAYLEMTLLDVAEMKDGRLTRTSGPTCRAPLSAYLLARRGEWGFAAIPIDDFVRLGPTPSSGSTSRRLVEIKGIAIRRITSEGPASMVLLKQVTLQMRVLELPPWCSAPVDENNGWSPPRPR